MSQPLEIVKEFPPFYDWVGVKMGVTPPYGVIFTYGERIYNPHGVEVHPALMAHERVHSRRQLATDGGPDAWWERYLIDDAYRFDEEAVAHRAEYLAFCSREHDPKRRAQALSVIAGRLASPLYGRIATPHRARRAVLGLPDEAPRNAPSVTPEVLHG
jgi:hypothetical protein